jgi:hypothetical protein
MPWFRVDDTLHSHPKPRKAGLAAIGLWTVAGSYCSEYVTEGSIPTWYVTGWPSGRKLAERLVLAGFWHAAGHNCRRCPQPKEGDSWQFHDWEHYQMTKDEIERDREANRDRQRRFREKRREARDAAIHNGA